MLAALIEREAGSGEQLANGFGHYDLASGSLRCDAGSEVDGESATFLAHRLTLAAMDSGPCGNN